MAKIKPIVALFGYRRADHLRGCWRSLTENKEAADLDLIVFLDGPKNKDEEIAIEKTRAEASKIRGFRNIRIFPQAFNLGLAASILEGVTKILKENDAVVVLEDDLVVSPHFLGYMNGAVALYKDHPAVASVHGYVYPCRQKLPETFFMKGADCWGWATWRSAWKKFEPDGSKLLEQLRSRKLEKEFDLGGVGPFTGMLQQQIQGKNDSWAIRWHASAFLAGMHTLYPGRSLVRNTGLDSSGTHCETTKKYDSPLSKTPIRIEPIPVVESEVGRKAFKEFYQAQK